MTCQPAIQIYLSLPVALDTKPHLKPHSLNAVHGLDQAMTLFTCYTFPDVALVVKEGKFRKIVNLYPWYGSLGLQIFMLSSYLRMIGDNVVMTVETFFHRRYSRKGGASHVRVTKLTGYGFHPRMHVVTKGDGLVGTEAFLRSQVKKVEEHHH